MIKNQNQASSLIELNIKKKNRNLLVSFEKNKVFMIEI